MKPSRPLHDTTERCAPARLNRRDFLAGCAVSAAAAGLSHWGGLSLGAEPQPLGGELLPEAKPRIRLVFTHGLPETPGRPEADFDCETRKRQLSEQLVRSCPQIDFLPATASNLDEAKRILTADKDVDGYLVYMTGCWSDVWRGIAATGKPTVLVGGSAEMANACAEAVQKGLKVAPVVSSNLDDVVRACQGFVCLKKMQNSTVLLFSEGKDMAACIKASQEVWGTRVKVLGAAQLAEALSKVDKKAATCQASRWIDQARRVVEPKRKEIEKSAAMYLAMKGLLARHGAQAVSIESLPSFDDNKLSPYLALALFQLNNDGLVGTCEGDLHCTMTMLLMNYLVGRCGVISAPLIDTSKNQAIYAHCVSSSRVFGPAGAVNAYDIRSHGKDCKGAAACSHLPLGEMTTTLVAHAVRKELSMHQGVSVASIDGESACANKLAVTVKGEASKLLPDWWRMDWHRVTCFGDHRKQLETLSQLMGFRLNVEA